MELRHRGECADRGRHADPAWLEVIAEAGLAALWLAAALAALQLALAVGVGGAEGRRIGAVRAVAVGQGALSLIAFAALIALFLRSDLSVMLVAENSHADKRLLDKVAGSWGNREGSMLLLVTVLASCGAVVALFERRLDERTLVRSLGAQAALSLGFFAFLLTASKPFERLSPAPLAGRGLNPLLQDAGLALLQPTLYLGYAGLAVAFSLAVGALVTRQVGPALARAMRRWVLGAWILLTLAITAGSYLADYEPGRGGWLLDPVANAALMPWLAATALLHSLSLFASRGAGRSLRRTPLAAWGRWVAHVGVAVAILGMASASAFTSEKLVSAVPGERIAVGPWQVEFRSVIPLAGPNWTALEAELRASRGGGVTVLKPQSRFFTEPPTTINEAAIETDWNGQLYAVLGAQDEATGRWQVRLWWKPFVTLIWLGGVLTALGGGLALTGRVWRARRR